MSDLKRVGKPARRADALDKVLGRAKYVADYRLPGMLHARALKSGLPHARISRLDVAPAMDVPGVRGVITCEDFAGHGLYGYKFKEKYVLACRRVRYAGEAIAVVAAETPGAAADGVRAIVCELEPLPAVFDVDEAVKPGAPIVGEKREEDGSPPNFLDCQTVRRGDAAAVLEGCDVVVDETYRAVPQEHAYMETEGALAIPTPEGGLLIYAPTQSPFVHQETLSGVLGLPTDRIRVIQTVVGGAFGGKMQNVDEVSALAGMLALKTGRPVRMVLSRSDSISWSYKGAGMRTRVRLGAGSDGRLRACSIEGAMDVGGYSVEGWWLAVRAGLHVMGPYRYDACDVKVSAVYTNNGYAGSFRGYGNPQACFAIEQAIDEMADSLGMDPMEFRLKNCLRRGDETAHGQLLNCGETELAECLEKVRRASGWDGKRAAFAEQSPPAERRGGIGVAAVFHGIALGEEDIYAGSALEVTADHKINLACGLTEYGPGAHTVFTMVAAEELGVDPARIRVLPPDTDTAPKSGPTIATRTVMVGGNAVFEAARRLAQTVEFAAADLLGCGVDRLARDGEGYVGHDEEPVSWEQVVDHAREMGLSLSARGRWAARPLEWDRSTGRGTPYPDFHFGAQVAEVEVDVRTGKVDVTGFWAAHGTGMVVYPQGTYGQIYGGVAQGLGYALLETVDFVEGRPQNVNFDGYLLPTSLDVPEIRGLTVEKHFPYGPYGAKNVGEPTMIPVAPAILNAVAQATGRRIRELPANLERVLLGHDLRRA